MARAATDSLTHGSFFLESRKIHSEYLSSGISTQQRGRPLFTIQYHIIAQRNKRGGHPLLLPFELTLLLRHPFFDRLLPRRLFRAAVLSSLS
jgi:hypothetical protein